MAAQTEHRRKMSKFYAAQEGDIDIEDTEIGRVRIKLSRLMAKKMSGNPAFKRRVENMMELLERGDELRVTARAKAQAAAQAATPPPPSPSPTLSDRRMSTMHAEKIKTWKPMAV